jgi:tetratricopeptide (TPR) repeat protein
VGTNEFNHFLKDLGHLYYEIANYTEAKKAYEEYKKCFPADNAVNTKLALCYKELGDYKKAKRLLN